MNVLIFWEIVSFWKSSKVLKCLILVEPMNLGVFFLKDGGYLGNKREQLTEVLRLIMSDQCFKKHIPLNFLLLVAFSYYYTGYLRKLDEFILSNYEVIFYPINFISDYLHRWDSNW